MRSALNRALRAGLCALLAMALGTAVPDAARAQVLELQPDEVLLTAQAAFASGNYPVANHLARALLLVDPMDPYALLILAATEPALGNPDVGLQAGQAAWKAARVKAAPKPLKYEIARNTARAAFEAGRPTVAQYWLRRALDIAPSGAEVDRTGADLAYVRNRNPWRWQFDLQAGPSDNLNGGAADPIFRIDDHVIGELGDGSLAVAGQRASLRVAAYRALPMRGRIQPVLGFSLQTTVNRIDDASQQDAGTLTSRDLNSTRLAASVQINALIGQADIPLSFAFEAGQTWAGGAVLGPGMELSVQMAVWRDGQGAAIWLGAEGWREWQDSSAGRVDRLSLSLSGETPLNGGEGRLSLGLRAENQESESVNATWRAVRLTMGYEPGWSLGGWADLGFSAHAGWRRYDTFSLGFANVTGGRTDESFGLSVDLTLQDWSVMGFAPVVTLSHGQTKSNVSRYETNTTAVSLGISSVF